MYAKSIYDNIRISSTIVNSIQVVSTIFMNCRTNDHGGAIFCDNVGIAITVFFCGFSNCWTTGSLSHGGGICVKQAKESHFHTTCFRDCYAYRCPGYIIWGLSGNIVYNCSVNLTSESNAILCEASSVTYAVQRLIYSENNVSNSRTNQLCAGVIMAIGYECTPARFFTICNTSGNSIMYFCPSSSVESLTVEYANFKSVRTEPGFGIASTSFNGILYFKKCTFIESSFHLGVYRYGASTGTCHLVQCTFDSLSIPSSLLNCVTNSLTITNPFTLNPHSFVQTEKCWFYSNIIPKTFISNTSPYSFTIPFLYIIIYQ